VNVTVKFVSRTATIRFIGNEYVAGKQSAATPTAFTAAAMADRFNTRPLKGN